jgi:hypothetical protein
MLHDGVLLKWTEADGWSAPLAAPPGSLYEPHGVFGISDDARVVGAHLIDSPTNPPKGIWIWDGATPEPIYQAKKPFESLKGFALSSDGQQVFGLTETGPVSVQLGLWTRGKASPMTIFEGYVSSLAANADMSTALFASFGKTYRWRQGIVTLIADEGTVYGAAEDASVVILGAEKPGLLQADGRQPLPDGADGSTFELRPDGDYPAMPVVSGDGRRVVGVLSKQVAGETLSRVGIWDSSKDFSLSLAEYFAQRGFVDLSETTRFGAGKSSRPVISRDGRVIAGVSAEGAVFRVVLP